MRSWKLPLPLALCVVCACEVVDTDPDPEALCPAAPAATRGVPVQDEIVAARSLDPTEATEWSVATWATSSLSPDSENVVIAWSVAQPNALTLRGKRAPRSLDPKVQEVVYNKARLARLEHHRQIWSRARSTPIPHERLVGTQITGHQVPGVFRIGEACAAENPTACGSDAVCVIPSGASAGTCENTLDIQFRGATGTELVTADVVKVGQGIAVVVDQADTVDSADIDELVARFDDHIAPRVHQFFGEPTFEGKDRDQNGVVMAFLTSRVTAQGEGIVGFFDPRDIEPNTPQDATGNEADVLYFAPPSATIDLDAISGTLAHEYEHLINYYAKVTRAESSPEALWLDEGLAAFAEDIAGYGQDAFKNVWGYLDLANDTSLTGFGLVHGDAWNADSIERRGMAHLFVRYIFEQAGGATFPDGPGTVTDTGGVAKIRALVQSEDTDFDALDAILSSVDDVLPDFVTAVLVDGTQLECVDAFGFAAPETDAYTAFQRGVNLRKFLSLPDGTILEFEGPRTLELTSVDDSLPTNGGQFYRLNTTATTELSLSTSSDVELGFRAFETPGLSP